MGRDAGHADLITALLCPMPKPLLPVRELVITLLPVLLLTALAGRAAEKPRQCAGLAWVDGCTSLPLGLDDDTYAKALAIMRAYECGLEPVAGFSPAEMARHIKAANALLPQVMQREGIPLALLDNPLFHHDTVRMAIEMPCKDLDL